MDVMVVGGKSQNLLLPTTMAKAGVVHVKDIREQAKSASLQAIHGASALSILGSARSLADAGFELEQNGDLSGALFKYSQAARYAVSHLLDIADRCLVYSIMSSTRPITNARCQKASAECSITKVPNSARCVLLLFQCLL